MASSAELTFERLLDWLEGRLSAQEAATVAALVAAADADTQAEVAWARAFLRVSDALIIEEPPPQVQQVLQQQFADHWQMRKPAATAIAAQPSFFQRLRAALTFDSQLQVGLAGARGAETEAPRQLIYSTELVDIALNLRLDPTSRHFTLWGQILPLSDPALTLSVNTDSSSADPAAFSVQLLQDEAEVSITLTDSLGEFTFADLPPGAYDLILSSDQLDIVISPVALRHH